MRTQDDLAKPYQTDWASLSVVYWITLVSEASRGLLLPSAWPFVKSVGGSKADLGILVASFSMGRMVTTIPLGYLSDNYSTATVLALASFVQVLGHIWYGMSSSLVALFLSRIFVGFGSSTMSVCRAHLTRTILPEERTHHFAYLSAVQFIGFGVLPGVGGLLTKLPEFRVLGFGFNGYTYPAYVLVICNIVSVFLVLSLFADASDRSNSTRNAVLVLSTSSTSLSTSEASGESSPSQAEKEEMLLPGEDPYRTERRKADVRALLSCILVNFTFRGLVAELETVVTPVLMERFNLSYGKSSYYISLVGLLGLGVYIYFKPLASKFSDRDLVLLGLFLVFVGAIPLAYPPLAHSLPFSLYMTAIGVLWSLAYPIGQTSALSVFSKVLQDLPVGTFLGMFSASGSLARIFFAILAGLIFGRLGQEAVFATSLGCMTISAILVVTNYKRLVSPGRTRLITNSLSTKLVNTST